MFPQDLPGPAAFLPHQDHLGFEFLPLFFLRRHNGGGRADPFVQVLENGRRH